MIIKKIDFSEVSGISDMDAAFTRQDPIISPLQKWEPAYNTFEKVIQQRKKSPCNRSLLVETLTRQYEALNLKDDQSLTQIHSLNNEDTFTIVTAHQPCLMTGPLYYIYKIISAIKLADNLKEQYPHYHFVPVFISGGEDHDFEEINHFYLFGQRFEWKREASGSVGRLNTEGIATVLSQLDERLGSGENAEELRKLLDISYGSIENYGAATRKFVYELFKGRGLLILNMDDAALKQEMQSIFLDDLLRHSSENLVKTTQEQIEKAGFSSQAYVRPINLFYLDEETRERIEKENGTYKVLNTTVEFNQKELEALVYQKCEKLSPNVVLRPLYQEKILPNLAYVGGGGEIAYWLERMTQFAHYDIPYPMLVRRDSALIIDNGTMKKLEKLGLSYEDLLKKDLHVIIQEYVKDNADHSVELNREKEEIEHAFTSILEKGIKIDASLKGKIEAIKTQQLKTVEDLEKRLIKAEKDNHDTAIQQIEKLKEKLFPDGKWQERHDNFINFYLRQGKSFFQELYDHFDPLDMHLKVFLPE